jgi:hypothetical protein
MPYGRKQRYCNHEIQLGISFIETISPQKMIWGKRAIGKV